MDGAVLFRVLNEIGTVATIRLRGTYATRSSIQQADVEAGVTGGLITAHGDLKRRIPTENPGQAVAEQPIAVHQGYPHRALLFPAAKP
jgi:hypothetical protein